MEFINEKKIVDYLQVDMKRALVGVDKDHVIVVKSPISNLRKLVDFVEPLNYYVSYVCDSIYIRPNI